MTIDVFLCYNSQDKQLIQKIAEELKLRGLYPWIDENGINAGEAFDNVIKNAISITKSAAIFFSSDQLGKYQWREIQAFNEERKTRDLVLIPILLPDVTWDKVLQYNALSYNDSLKEIVCSIQKISSLELTSQEINENKLFLDKLVIAVKTAIISMILKPYYKNNKHEVERAYELSLPETYVHSELPSSVEEIIKYLNLPQQKEKYIPINLFIGNILIRAEDESFKSELTQWGYRFIKEFNILIERLRQEDEQRNYNLFVAIIEQQASYLVEAWMRINVYGDDYKYKYKKLPFSKEARTNTIDKELNKLIHEILKELIDTISKKYIESIEEIHIFLPSKLMNHPFERWETSTGANIGQYFKVLLRCSERLKGKNQHIIKWQKKQSSLKSKLSKSTQESFIVADSDNVRGLKTKLLMSKEVIAVKITKFLSESENVGNVLFQTAVPIALWIREDLSQMETELNNLLNGTLQEVPQEVKNKRIEAGEFQQQSRDIGHHLCLLWDDPNLLPPEQLLTETYLK